MTKTVDGMCADCWGVKDRARAKRWLRGPRTQPLFISRWFDWEDPLDLLWGVGAVVLLVLVVVYAAVEWI